MILKNVNRDMKTLLPIIQEREVHSELQSISIDMSFYCLEIGLFTNQRTHSALFISVYCARKDSNN